MSRLMDAPGWFDIEFVDSWMFLYTRSPMNLTDQATWELISYLQDSLTTRISDVAASYNDDRVTPRAFSAEGVLSAGFPGQPLVAAQGRRLQVSWTPWKVAFVALAVGGVVFQVGFMIFSALMRR